MSTHLTTDGAAAALVMAEALSSAVRGTTGDEAVARIRDFAGGDDTILEQAQRRCLAFGQLDRHSRQEASSLIGRARAQAATGDHPPRG